MNNKKFYNLIKKDKYQVFIFICPGMIPFNFFSHPWFVINKKGILSRWELLFRKNRNKTSWNHLHKNFLPIFQGIEIFPFTHRYFWKSRLLGFIEGNKDSTARLIIKLIESSKKIYPYNNKYFLTGPNSNTYAQWILNNFPQFKVRLPSNCFGKDYIIKGK